MLTRLKEYLVALYLREPARSNAAIVTAVLAIAGAVGVAVSAPVVLTVVVIVAPFVVAELTRPRVTPDATLNTVEPGEAVLVNGPAKFTTKTD